MLQWKVTHAGIFGQQKLYLMSGKEKKKGCKVGWKKKMGLSLRRVTIIKIHIKIKAEIKNS